ncbi:hypothetical protein [Rhodothermus marinus]|uniref:hypothetical protein n=1 Tax=Rhodothermus marinus TaxID=29549 RepID=UPI001FB33FEC|nr:hypothetical protein [Rhodothermus marinus]
MVSLLGLAGAVRAQPVVYQEVPLRQVLDDVARRSGYQVLYRDALVEGRTVTLQTTEAHLIEALTRELARQGLVLEADTARRSFYCWKPLRATSRSRGRCAMRRPACRCPMRRFPGGRTVGCGALWPMPKGGLSRR